MNVVEWAEARWVLPETDSSIVLRPWQKVVLRAMFPADGVPSPWETFLISTVKKAGKTTLNGVATLYAALTFPAPETAFVVANDLAQAQERVFDIVADQVRRQRLPADVGKSEIRFHETGTRIVALPADYAGAAGANFGVSSWTELWAYRDEAHQRLWEELTPVPNRRSLRIVDSYAGITADAPVLEPMWKRALAGERLDDELPIFASGRLWAFVDSGEEAQRRAWLGDPADMAAYYAEQRASLRPSTFSRLHLNRWQTGEESFIEARDWDSIVDLSLAPAEPYPYSNFEGGLYVGLDVGVRHDASACVAVGWDGAKLRLARHRIWTPRKGEPLDLEATIERWLLDLADRFDVARVLYDPYQAHRSATTLARAGLPMVELPQTSDRLVAAGQGLYELIRGRVLRAYPDDELRGHVLGAVALDSGGRGFRIAKEKARRRVDGCVALAFACLAARDQGGWADAPELDEDGNPVPDWLLRALTVKASREVSDAASYAHSVRGQDAALRFSLGPETRF